ncbi:MAG: G1 family glutamic endopeptidase [Ktedonobacteraceae bacterium]
MEHGESFCPLQRCPIPPQPEGVGLSSPISVKKINRKFRRAIVLAGILGLVVGQLFLISPTFAQQSQATSNSPAQLQDFSQYGEAHCVQPPQNVDLMTLSDAQLSLYGLPLHAMLDKQPAKWASHLAHAKQRTCGTSPSTSHITHQHPSHTAPVSNTIQRTDPIWAGNVAYGSRATYRVASVNFTVPSIPSIGSSDRVSIWAGVGGDTDFTSSVMLVQVGVDVSRATFGGQYNTSWWEIAPYNAEQNLPLSRLKAGDRIFALASSSADNNGNNYFYIDNETVNNYNSHSDNASKHLTDGATGECIVERPTVGKTISHLANFGTEQLNSCDISSVSQSKYIINWPHDYYIMQDSSGNTLATVGAIVNNNYPIYWKRSS